MAEQPWWRAIADAERDCLMTDEEDAMAMAAYFALLQGNLEPLAAFLRQGFQLNYLLRREIVHAITGEDNQFYRLELHQRGKRGQTNVVSKLRTRLRDNAIGRYVQAQLPKYDNQAEAAFNAASKKFRVERGVVVAAWSRWKKLPPWSIRL